MMDSLARLCPAAALISFPIFFFSAACSAPRTAVHAIYYSPQHAAYESRSGESQERFDRGLECEKQGRHDDAIQAYTEALEIDPAHVCALNNRGNNYTIKKEYDKALLDYDRALELDSRHAETYFNRGMIYGNQKRFDRALADFQKYIELPGSIPAFGYFGIAWIYDEKNDTEAALALFRRALKSVRSSSEARYMLMEVERDQTSYRNIRKSWEFRELHEKLSGLARDPDGTK